MKRLLTTMVSADACFIEYGVTSFLDKVHMEPSPASEGDIAGWSAWHLHISKATTVGHYDIISSPVFTSRWRAPAIQLSLMLPSSK